MTAAQGYADTDLVSQNKSRQCVHRIYRVLTKDEQELLGSTQSEDRDETAAFPIHNVVDCVAEASFSFLPLLMDVGSIC